VQPWLVTIVQHHGKQNDTTVQKDNKHSRTRGKAVCFHEHVWSVIINRRRCPRADASN